MTFNRKTANTLLGIVTLLFLISVGLNRIYHNYLWIRLLNFVSEAALVGGIADWFAVTALFKKPIPLPIPQPHTALIPSNREKLIDAVSKIVETELITVSTIKAKFEEIMVIDQLIEWTDEDDRTEYLFTVLAHALQNIITQLDPDKLASYIEKLLKENSNKLDLHLVIKKLILSAMEKGEDDVWINYALKEFTLLVEQPKTRVIIYNYLVKTKEEKCQRPINKIIAWVCETVDAINLEDAALASQKELLALLNELKDPKHVLRQEVKELLREIVLELGESEYWKRAIESWKEGVIERVNLHDLLKTMITALINVASSPVDELDKELMTKAADILDYHDIQSKTDEPILVQWTLHLLKDYWAHFKQNDAVKSRIERYIKKALYSIIEAEHHLLGNTVKETLNSLTEDKLNKFIDDKVGSDLQGIRINGSIIGSIVGLVIFIFTNYLYSPIIIPWLAGLVIK